jgi:plasmid stabilization system protein ParE
MKIIWSHNATKSYFDILDFLVFLWNEEVETNFITLVDEIEELLLKNNFLGKPYNNNVREIILHKNASLYYKINQEEDCIEFLLFKDNRQNPESYLKLL